MVMGGWPWVGMGIIWTWAVLVRILVPCLGPGSVWRRGVRGLCMVWADGLGLSRDGLVLILALWAFCLLWSLVWVFSQGYFWQGYGCRACSWTWMLWVFLLTGVHFRGGLCFWWAFCFGCSLLRSVLRCMVCYGVGAMVLCAAALASECGCRRAGVAGLRGCTGLLALILRWSFLFAGWFLVGGVCLALVVFTVHLLMYGRKCGVAMALARGSSSLAWLCHFCLAGIDVGGSASRGEYGLFAVRTVAFYVPFFGLLGWCLSFGHSGGRWCIAGSASLPSWPWGFRFVCLKGTACAGCSVGLAPWVRGWLGTLVMCPPLCGVFWLHWAGRSALFSVVGPHSGSLLHLLPAGFCWGLVASSGWELGVGVGDRVLRVWVVPRGCVEYSANGGALLGSAGELAPWETILPPSPSLPFPGHLPPSHYLLCSALGCRCVIRVPQGFFISAAPWQPVPQFYCTT
ncbi:uncharacterized protein LOC124871426 [Girardinichthys multiradiatus]|uniref:uncharacterized protein LOC124871426 n=1 Tax=Girardinichthys multiradiatus TaxID=208333 RepID=UPI001FACB9AE|nr:uncharacterized protein LOC124871426 [Girardinichthys multiradiatus]